MDPIFCIIIYIDNNKKFGQPLPSDMIDCTSHKSKLQLAKNNSGVIFYANPIWADAIQEMNHT